MDINLKIELPQQTGCNHIHVTAIYPDGHTELHQWHISDFGDELTQNEPIYYAVRQKILDAKSKNRNQIKTLLDNTTIKL